VTVNAAKQQVPPAASSQTTVSNNPPCSATTPALTEPRESFSQLTLFLFASGLALFVALLGWSDQIRGIDKDTRELEQRFLEDSGISKRDFLRIVKPRSADEQLLALTEIVNAGRIRTRSSAELLRTFTAWNVQWSKIEKLSSIKYNLTIALTIVLFVTGVGSLFTSPMQRIRIFSLSLRVELIILMLPIAVISILFVIIILSAQREKTLRSLVKSVADMV
jgi:hypothetical protein